MSFTFAQLFHNLYVILMSDGGNGMITFLNGREVLITYDVDVFANARDDLKDAGVEFKIK